MQIRDATPVWIALDRIERNQHLFNSILEDIRESADRSAKVCEATASKLERWETSWPPILRASAIIVLALAAGVKADTLFAVVKSALGAG